MNASMRRTHWSIWPSFCRMRPSASGSTSLMLLTLSFSDAFTTPKLTPSSLPFTWRTRPPAGLLSPGRSSVLHTQQQQQQQQAAASVVPSKRQPRKRSMKGFYVRPSKALEVGGGFFVPGRHTRGRAGQEGRRKTRPAGLANADLVLCAHNVSGLEGWRLPVAGGLFFAVCLAVNHLASLEVAIGQTITEAIGALAVLTLITQGLFRRQLDMAAKSGELFADVLERQRVAFVDEQFERDYVESDAFESVGWMVETLLNIMGATAVVLASREKSADGGCGLQVVLRAGDYTADENAAVMDENAVVWDDGQEQQSGDGGPCRSVRVVERDRVRGGSEAASVVSLFPANTKSIAVFELPFLSSQGQTGGALSAWCLFAGLRSEPSSVSADDAYWLDKIQTFATVQTSLT